MTTSENKSVIFEAIEFAVKAHSGQYRKGSKVPYIVHPIAVGKMLIEAGCSDEVVIAGLLHDTIEDAHITSEEIENRFGARVRKLVEAASEMDKSKSWEDRKQNKVNHLRVAEKDAVMVELADKIDNISALRRIYPKVGEAMWNRFNRPKDSQRWYYQCLVDAFASRNDEEPIATFVKKFFLEVKQVFGDSVTIS